MKTLGKTKVLILSEVTTLDTTIHQAYTFVQNYEMVTTCVSNLTTDTQVNLNLQVVNYKQLVVQPQSKANLGMSASQDENGKGMDN